MVAFSSFTTSLHLPALLPVFAPLRFRRLISPGHSRKQPRVSRLPPFYYLRFAWIFN